MQRFHKNLWVAIRDYSSWSTFLIVLLMVLSIAVAPYYPGPQSVSISTILVSLMTYSVMAVLSYVILILLTAIYDSPKMRWPYIFVSSGLAIVIGVYIIWIHLLGQSTAPATFETFRSAIYYMPFNLMVTQLCMFSKSEREAIAERLRHATYKERQQRDLAEMQLRLLQAQIEPHFLYNTMAHLDLLIVDEPETASIFLDRLITYLRGVSPIMRKSLVPLGTELELFRSYLDIQSIRFGDKISYDIQQNNVSKETPIPSFLLLTLAENAMKHGLESSADGGHISLAFRVEQNKLIITHTNTGQELAPNWKPGIGLRNITQRLSSLYMENAQFTLEKTPTGKTRAIIEIPRTDESQYEH